MRKKVTGSGLLVVVELGGEWPQAPGTSTGADSASASVSASVSVSVSVPVSVRRVLSQAEGETPAEFTARVARSLDSLFGRGVRLSSVSLACNERLDEAAAAARRMLCSVTLGAMAKHKSGRFYLTAAARSSGRLRHALSSLAQGLSDEWESAGLEVSVQFGAESCSSVNASPAAAARVA
jgi:hypothetical protein